MIPSKFTSAQTVFDDLLSSRSFIDIVLNQSTNCFLMLNKEMRLQAFNSPLKTLFYNKHGEDYLLHKCGEVMGCMFSIDEDSECGQTSHCNACSLRAAALLSYAKRIDLLNQRVVRPFYVKEGVKEDKALNFSVHPFRHQGEYYTMMVIEDVSKEYKLQQRINELEAVNK